MATQDMYGITSTSTQPAPLSVQQWGSNQQQQVPQRWQQKGFIQQAGPVAANTFPAAPAEGMCFCGQQVKILCVKKQNENEGRWFQCCPQDKGFQCKKSFRWRDDIPKKQAMIRQHPMAPAVNLTPQFQQYRNISVGPNGQFVTPVRVPTALPATSPTAIDGTQTRALINSLEGKLMEAMKQQQDNIVTGLCKLNKNLEEKLTESTEMTKTLSGSMESMAGVMVVLKQENAQLNVQLTTVKVQLTELLTSLRTLNNSIISGATEPKPKTKSRKRTKTIPISSTTSSNITKTGIF